MRLISCTMKITGKKIVSLTDEERAVLHQAIQVLDALSEALGNDEFYDFEEIGELLYYIRTTDKFEMDFEQ